MKKLLILTLLFPLASFAQLREDGSFRTLLKGTVTGRDSKQLYVVKSQNFDREIDEKFIIPIVDGKFEFVFEGDHVQKYDLIFLDELKRGGWKPTPFFPDGEVVEFTLYDFDNAHNNTVSGGDLNRKFKEFQQKKDDVFKSRSKVIWEGMRELREKDLYYSDELKELIRQMREFDHDTMPYEEMVALYDKQAEMEKNKTNLTPEARILQDEAEGLEYEIIDWTLEYMKEHSDIVSYSLLADYLFSNHLIEPDPNKLQDAYEVLSAANPGHEYNERAGTTIAGLRKIKPGGSFVDFTAPDIDGKTYMLSDEIAGKIAVIDLWASWCSPCRVRSKRMIPIYEQYRDKGFTVVGVAREFRNTQDFKRAIERDGYPWLCLVEVDDKHGIWDKYGNANGTGLIILVDENGTVVHVDPSDGQIKEYLSLKLD